MIKGGLTFIDCSQIVSFFRELSGKVFTKYAFSQQQKTKTKKTTTKMWQNRNNNKA
jgi:hypothetical protein